MLYSFKFGKAVTVIPTVGFNIETVEYKNIKFKLWDSGGGDKLVRVLCSFVSLFVVSNGLN